MIRAAARAARLGAAATVAGVVLAVLRFGPVYAEPPFDVRALPLAPWALGLALVAALGAGRRRRAGPVRPLLLATLGTALLLAAAVAARGPVGIAGELHPARGAAVRLAPGPIDVIGQDLPVAPGREWSLRWVGPLRVPESGLWRLWVEGRGEVEVRVAGITVLRAAGQRLATGADVRLGRGEHRLEVVQRRERRAELRFHGIRGQRLRLGWIPPGDAGPGDRIPPRRLGPERPAALWLAIDALALALAVLAGLLVAAVPWDRRRVLPAPRRVAARDVLVSSALYAVALAAMSWPLARDPAGLGFVDRTDGRLNVWILAWVAHAVFREPARLFDAPIFHPTPNALALSENLLVPGLLGAPASLLGEPVLAYNLVLGLSLLVSGLGAELLVRRATGDRTAARVAGLLFAAGGFRWARLAHLHAHVTLFLPLALLALDRFWERPRLRRALAVGLLLAAQALSSIYLGAITATALAVATAVAVAGGLRAGALARLALGFALAGLVVAPVAQRYLASSTFHDTQWTLADVEPHAVTLQTWLASGHRAWGGLTGRHMHAEDHGAPLFPGALPLVLGIAGAACAPRRFRVVAVATSAVAVLLSLGPETAAYRWLHEHVVFFRGIRALARFSILVYLALAVLAGFALAGRRRLAVLAAALALLEAWSGPLRVGEHRPPGEAARWLADREGAVVRVPLGERDTEVMLDGLAHDRPLLNGYSGLTPRHYTWLHELLDGPRGPTTPAALRLLRAVGVSHVVAERDLALPLRARFGERRVYAVPPGEATALPGEGAERAALWRAEAVTVDLGEPALVERIGFALGGWPWRERPAVELSLDGLRWEVVEGEARLDEAVLALMRDPTAARGSISIPPRRTRYLRLRELPLRPGRVTVHP